MPTAGNERETRRRPENQRTGEGDCVHPERGRRPTKKKKKRKKEKKRKNDEERETDDEGLETTGDDAKEERGERERREDEENEEVEEREEETRGERQGSEPQPQPLTGPVLRGSHFVRLEKDPEFRAPFGHPKDEIFFHFGSFSLHSLFFSFPP